MEGTTVDKKFVLFIEDAQAKTKAVSPQPLVQLLHKLDGLNLTDKVMHIFIVSQQ